MKYYTSPFEPLPSSTLTENYIANYNEIVDKIKDNGYAEYRVEKVFIAKQYNNII